MLAALSCYYLYSIAKHASGNQHEIVNCSAPLVCRPGDKGPSGGLCRASKGCPTNCLHVSGRSCDTPCSHLVRPLRDCGRNYRRHVLYGPFKNVDIERKCQSERHELQVALALTATECSTGVSGVYAGPKKKIQKGCISHGHAC